MLRNLLKRDNVSLDLVLAAAVLPLVIVAAVVAWVFGWEDATW